MVSLQHLALADNGVELDGMRALAGKCFRHWHRLQHLNLSGNHVGSYGALALFQAAMLVPQLQFLSLSDCKLEQVSMCYLSVAAGYWHHLRHLDLCLNHVGSVGATALASAFRSWPRLQLLALKSTQLGDQGVAAPSASAEHLKQLTYLDMSHNDLSLVGVGDFC